MGPDAHTNAIKTNVQWTHNIYIELELQRNIIEM